MNEDIPMMKETPQNSRRETLLRYGCAVVTVAADRKSTRLNSSHSQISYAVFCLKKKKKRTPIRPSLCTSQRLRSCRCSSPDIRLQPDLSPGIRERAQTLHGQYSSK